MKWYRNKEIYTKPVFRARKNNYKFKAVSEKVLNDRDGFYLMILDTETDVTLNSLWIDIRFQKLESAQKWAEMFAEKRKETRVTRNEKAEWIASDESFTTQYSKGE